MLVLRLEDDIPIPGECEAQLACPGCHLHPTHLSGLLALVPERPSQQVYPWTANAKPSMDHHLSLATIHQLRAQFRSFQTYLESLRVAPSYIDLLCNSQEGTLVADPAQPDRVYQTYGDLIGAHHCKTATVTLNWPLYHLTRDG